jgi:hypothetical protein
VPRISVHNLDIHSYNFSERRQAVCRNPSAITSYVKIRAQIRPRLLKKEQAADYCGYCGYCGVGLVTFETICRVQVIALGSGIRLRRYDIVSLDKWIDSLSESQSVISEDWLSRMDEADGNDSARQRN